MVNIMFGLKCPFFTLGARNCSREGIRSSLQRRPLGHLAGEFKIGTLESLAPLIKLNFNLSILQNIHLVAKWLSKLEKKLEQYSEGSHESYRVYMSAEPAPIPESHIIPQV